MRLIREVLRLCAAGLSQRQIARSLGLSHGVVAKYQAAARRAGLTWPLPPELDDQTLANCLGPTPPDQSAPSAYLEPDFASIHQQLKRKGVTRQLLWEEYRAAAPERAYSYTQFCVRYREWRTRLGYNVPRN